MKRWKHLWQSRRGFAEHFVLDLQQARGSVQEGDYNLRWNNQLVQALVELEAIDAFVVLADNARILNSEVGGDQHSWFSADLRRMDLEDPSWWESNWKPWRSTEISRASGSLDALRAVINSDIRVCAAIAEEYRPSNGVIRLFGDAAQWVAPETVCGRCPRCRTEDEEPSSEASPEPNQRWFPEGIDVGRLERFIRNVGTDHGLAVITADDVHRVASELASRLLGVGVRHFAGCDPPQTNAVFFHDLQPISPRELTPLPSFVVIERGDLTYSPWLSRFERQLNRILPELALDVLLISEDVVIPKGMRTRSFHAALADLSNG